jgi:hypothetical protein
MGSGCIDPHFIDLGTIWRWVVNFTPRPLYPRGKSPGYPLDRRLGGPQCRSAALPPEKQPLVFEGRACLDDVEYAATTSNNKGVKSWIEIKSSTYVITISGFLNPCRGQFPEDKTHQTRSRKLLNMFVTHNCFLMQKVIVFTLSS